MVLLTRISRITRIMKKQYLIIILIGLLFCSCKTAQVIPPKPVLLQTSERVTTRLKPVTVSPDSAYIAALFECDSSRQVVLRQLAEAKSKGVNSDYTFSDGLLKYSAKIVHDTIYVPVTDSSLYKEIPVPYAVLRPEVNKISGWQWVQIYAGRLLLGALLLFGVYKLVKSNFSFKNLLKLN